LKARELLHLFNVVCVSQCVFLIRTRIPSFEKNIDCREALEINQQRIDFPHWKISH